MRLGLGLSICDPHSTSVPAFNPATLSLAGWWRASFSASPWSGVSSAAGSGGRDLTEATNPPTAGSLVNGFAPVSFDGVSKIISGTAVSAFCGVNAIYGWALVNVAAITTNATGGASLTNNVLWITSATGQSGVFFRDSGSAPTVGIHILTTGLGSFVAETSISKSAWQLVQWKWDGTTASIRANNGAFATNTLGTAPANSLSANLIMSRNSANDVFTQQQVLELALTGSGGEVLSTAQFDSVRSYCNSRYGVAV